MIVKMQWEGYERLVDCDTVHKTFSDEECELAMYKDGKLIENPRFKDSVRVFIMEQGKTVDSIYFKVNQTQLGI